jgi:hypothetical protein
MKPLLLVLVLWFQQSDYNVRTLDTVRDQVMINTNRLDNVERQLYAIQATTDPSMVRLSVIDSQLSSLIMTVNALQSTLYSLLAFIFVQTFGLAVFGVKFYLKRDQHAMEWKDKEKSHSDEE